MSTYTQLLYQLVFGSKDHLPFLSPKNQDILFAYIAGVLKNKSRADLCASLRNLVEIKPGYSKVL
jgi:hypothetical protein